MNPQRFEDLNAEIEVEVAAAKDASAYELYHRQLMVRGNFVAAHTAREAALQIADSR